MIDYDILNRVLSAARASFGREVDKYDNFFSLGGDSIIAILLAEKMERLFGVEIDINVVLDAAHFADLAERIGSESGGWPTCPEGARPE